jgi:hypothetical protein
MKNIEKLKIHKSKKSQIPPFTAQHLDIPCPCPVSFPSLPIKTANSRMPRFTASLISAMKFHVVFGYLLKSTSPPFLFETVLQSNSQSSKRAIVKVIERFDASIPT